MIPDRLAAALADRYRIERELGAGGMATVYLAEDLRHDRKVAIKVLKPELAAVLGAERFVQEIKTTAQLQHPHILPLFDSGTAGGFLYYVMPYLEGETVREKLNRETQLGVAEAVRITTEVADALDYAHRHGVIHRDIKPENILLHDGRPMVMDFGIALAVSAAAGGRMTETGLSLGTPHYMSPEQATADRDITARSDIYSLASVLYEMLAGEPPHMGNSAQQIIMKIVTEEAAPVTRLRKSVPPNVAAALSKALEKLPADRFDTAREFGEALKDPAFTGPSAAPAASDRVRRSPAVTYLLMAACVALAALSAWCWLRSRRTPVAWFIIGFPTNQAPSYSAVGTHVALSRDGAMLAYISGPSGDSRLWIKRRDALTAEPIPGTEGAYDPFFSPDGRQLGFITDRNGRAMKIVSLAGGPPHAVPAAATRGMGTGGACWASDGYIYFDADLGGLQRVKPDGTGLETVVPLDSARNETGVAWPEVLPDNKVVVFRLRHGTDAPGDFAIVALRIGTTERRVVARGVSARYASGRLLWVTADGTLQAAPFDERHLALTGPATGAGYGVRVYGAYAGADLSITESGDLYYVAGAAGAATTLDWVTRDGVTRPVDTTWNESSEIRGLALAPDGKEVALDLARPTGTDIWIKHLPAGALTRLTLDSAADSRPRWSGDGRDVLFLSERVKPAAIFRRREDGTGHAVLVAHADRSITEASESRDGRWLVARTSSSERGNGDILAMEVGRDTMLRPIVATAAAESNPDLSPDGRWLLYVSTASGRREVYVRPFPDVNGGVWQISTEGGVEPRWSHAGNEIFFRGLASPDMMAVDVQTTPAFHAGAPHVLFHTDAVTGLDYPRYDVAPDDRRFLMVGHGGDTAPQLVRVEHVLQALERKPAP